MTAIRKTAGETTRKMPEDSRREREKGFRYEKVLREGRPVHAPLDAFTVRHPAMPLSRRAKIFSPFDALKGFREALSVSEERYSASVEERHLVSVKESSSEYRPSLFLPREYRMNSDEFSMEEQIMCTRFYIDISDEELREIVSAAEHSALADRFLRAGDPLTTSGEVRPTNVVPVIATSRAGNRGVFPMKWGFHIQGPRDSRRDASPDSRRDATPGSRRDAGTVSLLLNARSETAARKQIFRESWRQHRCVIPASYYFEWEHFTSPDGRKKTGQKYAIQPEGSAVTWLGGLYRVENGLPCFVVLTRPPAESIAFIHDRMPVILPENQINNWIDPQTDPAEIIPYSLNDMIFDSAV